MEENSQKGKRVVKNTMFLFIRMFLLLLISLYTSRVVLDKLGVEDYGIYNIVGGLAGMFAFFSGSVANAMQRFLSFEMGKGDDSKLRQVYSQSILIFVTFAVLIVILCESFGLWFVYNKLVIPIERMQIAVYVYHITVLMVCINFVGLAYNSILISHENMKIYSYVGIVEGIAKLAIVYLLSIANIDRLLLYALLLLVVCVSVQGFYAIYCRHHYSECRIQRVSDFTMLKSIGGFMGWNAAGAVIYMTKDSGLNILLNLFFGPVVNAARGLAFQINAAISQFTNGIFVSVQPQMTKAYASGDRDYLMNLFFRSTKYSVLAFYMIALPVMLCIDDLLTLWLVEVPEYVATFSVLVIIDSALAIMTNAPWGITIATGEIRNYQLLGNGILLLILPVSYVVLRLGYSPNSVFVITIIVRIMQVVTTHILANKLIHFGYKRCLKDVFFPILLSLLPITGLMLIIHLFMPSGFVGVILTTIVSTILMIIGIYCVATPSERAMAITFLKMKIKKN